MRVRNQSIFGRALGLCMGAAVCCGGAASGSTVWNGPGTVFAKVDFADATLAANQDRITSNVWLTRGSIQGLFNAKNESGFTHLLTPSGTTWADGSLADYSGLSYTNWDSWANSHTGGPPATIGVNAVVHLVADDVYLSIRFTAWTATGAGGGFSYVRSTAPAPASFGLLGLGGIMLNRRRRA
jgi:hypothetical protein